MCTIVQDFMNERRNQDSAAGNRGCLPPADVIGNPHYLPQRHRGKCRPSGRLYKSSRSLFVQSAKVPFSMHLPKSSHSHQRSDLAIAIIEATTSFASALDTS